MQRTAITIGGVPEHFNLPWHLAQEEGRFADIGIDLKWRDFPDGTGAMTRSLAAGGIDLALTLSQGTVAAIAKGLPIKILGWYVFSPLIWGIHVPADSGFARAEHLHRHRFAISRQGSGSHLMTYVLAQQMGWSTVDLKFLEIGTLEGAVKAFSIWQADGFLWERFTTQPLVDSGDLRRVGEIPTPWPAFVLAASESALQNHASLIRKLWDVMLKVCKNFKDREGINRTIAGRYRLDVAQVDQWLSLTEWSDSRQMSRGRLQEIVDTLSSLGLLQRPITPDDCASALTEFC